MKLKSFGCSLIFGTDLKDNGFGQTGSVPSQLTWPAHLARHLDRTYECYARPGAGNTQILEQILNQAAHADSTDIFVIGWTWIDRFDYYDAHWDSKKTLSPWRTIMPIDTDTVAETYYKNLHSEYRDKFVNLTAIKTAIDTLQQKNIGFLMTYMDRLLFDQRWHVTPAVLYLQSTIGPHMTAFENQTFLEWSRTHKFPESQNWHPLEQAHRAAADYMIRLFDTQKTNVLAQQVLF